MTSDSDQSSNSRPSQIKETSTTDHDSLWKEALEYYSQDFLELLSLKSASRMQ